MADPFTTSGALDRLLQDALRYAQTNGPHHPGSLPRFPVPSERNAGQIEVPLAILAVDDGGRRGLFAPARTVLLAFPGGQPTGVADFPGFDPDHWPPPRLGDWPPPLVRNLDREQLQAHVTRFGDLWLRLLAAWFDQRTTDALQRQATESLALLAQLDPPAMVDIYRRLSPRFWTWLGEAADGNVSG